MYICPFILKAMQHNAPYYWPGFQNWDSKEHVNFYVCVGFMNRLSQSGGKVVRKRQAGVAMIRPCLFWFLARQRERERAMQEMFRRLK